MKRDLSANSGLGRVTILFSDSHERIFTDRLDVLVLRVSRYGIYLDCHNAKFDV